MHIIDRVVSEVDRAADEAVRFTSDLVRIPTVNPPGAEYETAARFMGDWLSDHAYAVEYFAAEGRPEHTPAHPRVNVVGTRTSAGRGPVIHLNGHLDVVPPGDGWTVDPFAGLVRNGRIYGRGACDMKAGIAAAVFAAEAISRAGIDLPGAVEVSGTVDEESGGLAGVAHLATIGRLARARTDYVIIPEPLNVDRICIGHRGVYWFELTTRGRIAHGSMPFLGVSAIDAMTEVLAAIRHELEPRLSGRVSAMPVVPAAARRATINVNSLSGGQPIDGIQTPCVADCCRAVFDRRFLIEEGLDQSRAEIASLVDHVLSRLPGVRYEIRDLLVVEPVQTPSHSPLIGAFDRSIGRVIGTTATLVASPGTFDQKHVSRLAGIDNCVAYGPGELALAHQPDESCAVADLLNATKVIAVAMLDLAGLTPQ